MVPIDKYAREKRIGRLRPRYRPAPTRLFRAKKNWKCPACDMHLVTIRLSKARVIVRCKYCGIRYAYDRLSGLDPIDYYNKMLDEYRGRHRQYPKPSRLFRKPPRPKIERVKEKGFEDPRICEHVWEDLWVAWKPEFQKCSKCGLLRRRKLTKKRGTNV